MGALEVSEQLFRVLDPAYSRDNIYRHAAKISISLGPVMIATIAQHALPWVTAEVLSENNYRWRTRNGPADKDGLPDHLALQREGPAAFVGISASITNAAPRALEVIRLYREMPAGLSPRGIIVGGWHAGDMPEEFLRAGADVVVHGEGAVVIVPLLEAMQQGLGLEGIPGISYWRNGEIVRNGPAFLTISEEELERLPAPDFNLVRFAKLKMLPVSRTWGCSGRCRFCRVKSEPRSVSPHRFAQQIKVLLSKGHHEFFLVDDRSEEDLDGFTEWLREIIAFRKERKARGLDFTVQARLSLAERPEVLELMRAAGVRTVAIGFESPIPEEIWAMRKPVVPVKMVEWTRIWKRHGFFVHAMLIFGYPIPQGKKQPLNLQGQVMSARERGHAFWRFLRAAKPDTIQVLTLTPLPGTEDWIDLDRQGRIFKELGWEAWDGLHVVFEPDAGITPQELQKEVVRLHRKFYAFRYLGGLGLLSLVAHLLKIGVATVSMPFLWLLILLSKWPLHGPFAKQAAQAWQLPSRIARNARLRFQAYMIVQSVQSKLDLHNRRLEAVLRTRDTAN